MSHATEGAARGIPARVLHAVAAWQQAGELLDPRQRAVLALTDAVTALGPASVTDEIWADAAQHLTEKQRGSIVLAVATINVWNRIAISTGMTPPVDAKHPVAPQAAS